jgi:hypothetical protein
MTAIRNAYRISRGNSLGQLPSGRMRRWEDIIRMDLGEIC